MSKLVSIRKHQYKLKEDGNTLQYTESEKDIGVTMDEKHSFDKHISEKVNKANSIMGIISRTMEYMDNNSFKLLYTALVRPHLEYANQVWYPHLAMASIKMKSKMYWEEPQNNYQECQI